MLKWPVFCAGAVMSLAGVVWLVQSFDIIQVERGWSGVIGGAVLIGSGGILMGLAALLHELGSWRAAALAGPLADGRAPRPPRSTDDARMDAGLAEPAPLSLPKAPPPDFAYEPVSAPVSGPVSAPAEPGGADHWKTILARTNAPVGRPVEPGAARDGRLARRYESHGVRYSLFDDGTIEAETESGVYAFASIEELRAFLDARKAARGA